ncbi:MAG: hypothetical protein OQL28_12345 [Sedimenticola sp.]|nr:hypothetical protein [Sedimenticola sp.]
MSLRYSQIPGQHERHLRKKQDNPLFPEAERQITPEQLEEAQRLDHEALTAFITDFRTLVHEVAGLSPNEGSEVILGLKERLDQAYEQAARMVDDQQETQQAITRLVGVIMQAVRRGAGTDPVALQELADEEAARQAHYALLEYPLVADLLDPESVIGEQELVPTLLSASEEELQAACSLFDPQQLKSLVQRAEALLDTTPDAPETAKARYRQLLRYL